MFYISVWGDKPPTGVVTSKTSSLPGATYITFIHFSYTLRLWPCVVSFHIDTVVGYTDGIKSLEF